MNLDAQQKAAVETQSRCALVIAGAGSGKTRVLVERIGHLIDKCHVSPYETLAFTFTRKAAGEMRSRLEARIGSHVNHITIGTMHAVALRMLRRFGEVIGLRPNNITVYSEWEEQFLLKEVAREIGVFKRTWTIAKKDIDAAFADYYQRGIIAEAGNPCRTLFDTFMHRCRENNALTYGALLMGLKFLIHTMAKHLRIKHILVDEAQDIDPLQWSIIRRMEAAFDASLFVVGDIRQSIYSFRGAVPEYLVDHKREFELYELQTNYRSVPEIVEAANRLMDHSTAFLGAGMIPARDGGVYRVNVMSDMDSAAIASVLSAHKTLFPDDASDCAVLARNHALLKKLSAELDILEVPHVYVGQKTAITNTEEFRRFHAFLKLLVNPYDNFSFLLMKDLIGITPEHYSQLRVNSAVKGKSHFQTWLESENGRNVYADNFFCVYPILIDSPAVASFRVKAIFQGAHPYGNPSGYDVEETFRFIFSWLTQNPNGTIPQYLDWLATYNVQDEISDGSDSMTLCTIHAAKGLEWPCVIVSGCNEGILPSKQAISSGQIEEERRLMYVAMTRAREQLILAVRPERAERDGRVYESVRSRFVDEAVTWIEPDLKEVSHG